MNPSNMVELKCNTCGIIFYRRATKIIKGRKTYCSVKCSVIARDKKVKITCKICDKTVYRSKGDTSNGRGIYCSAKCKGYDRRKRVIRKCDLCENEVELQFQVAKRRKRNFCSDECHKKGMSGENSFLWRGGTSFKSYCKKFNEALKKDIRTRFGKKCYLCGNQENGRKLDIHHIDYNKNSICNGKDWALIPLCRGCHSKTNHQKWFWFELLMNYWFMNPEINFLEISI
jgi:hypothetical protein